MESWSARDEDRPYAPPERKPAAWPWFAAAALALAAMSAAYYYYLLEHRPLRPPLIESAPAPAPITPAPVPAEAAVQNPLPAEQQSASLPTLDNSDALARDALVGLLGNKAFDEFVVPVQLVRRIVATVDNLPRPTAPRRAIPLGPVAGSFTADPRNAARYAPYVRVFEAIDTRSLVQRYVHAYPLFQRAYEELGFPGKYFNDRLVQAIDDLLAAPDAVAPKLVQAKVLYEFEDPALEQRSAGQKILLRMGAENAARVKSKLREIRRELGALRKP